jgi:hypothetical protein
MPVMVLAVLVWLGAGWLCWTNWHRRGGKAMAALEALRFVIMTVIGITLLKPEFVQKIVSTEPPEIVVLNDASGSMETRDVMIEPGRILRRDEWLQQRRQTNFWRPLEKNAKVVVEDFSRPSTNAAAAALEDGTDINEALESVRQRQKHLKAVLLLTDGDWNLGQSPLSAATRLRGQNVPIYTVAVGSETPLPDLVLQQVIAPSYGLMGEQISIPYRVQSFLPREVKTVITLSSARGVDVRKEVTIPAFAQLQDSIVWSPRALGEYTLNLKLPVQPDEYLADNNEQTFRISIRTEKLNVLVVDSLPRWEYRYLRNALSRDPGVAMNCLLYHPDLGVGQGSNYLSAFPDSKELLSKYDVVFIGDVGIGEKELKTEDAELLKGLVDQQGSGLVFLPGSRGRQLTLLGTPLAELLPVVYDDKKSEGISAANESNLILTGAGKGHFLTMLAADENRNDLIWKNLPGFYWCAAVLKSKPGSEVLAVHSAMRNAAGRAPLLVTRPYGNGEVLFMGTDSAWRWRKGVEDKYHYRFWGQVVRWMSHKRHMAQGEGIRLAFSPENPRVGESLFFQATILDIGGSMTEKDRVSARIVSPSGKVERLEFAPVTGGWGVFKTSFLPQEGGKYKLTITSEKGGSKLETEIVVTKPQREKLGQPANIAMLREISDLTRGASGTVTDLDAIVKRISALADAEPQERRLRLWANPWWGGAILFLLAIYWTARKVIGMI